MNRRSAFAGRLFVLIICVCFGAEFLDLGVQVFLIQDFEEVADLAWGKVKVDLRSVFLAVSGFCSGKMQ